VDNVEDQPPSSSFLVSIGVAADHFSWRHFPYLLVNEENQPFTIIMKLWKSAPCLGNVPLQRLELRAKKRREKWASRGSHFSLSF
jgi:hypothetical protein